MRSQVLSALVLACVLCAPGAGVVLAAEDGPIPAPATQPASGLAQADAAPSQPTAAETAVVPVAVAAPAAAGTAANGAAAPHAAATHDAEPAPPAKFVPPPGYRAVKRGDDTVYCTSIKPIGSNLPKTVCLNQEQLAEVERRAKSVRREIDTQQKICASAAGSCGGT
jgi:hypothetical protein